MKTSKNCLEGLADEVHAKKKSIMKETLADLKDDVKKFQDRLKNKNLATE